MNFTREQIKMAMKKLGYTIGSKDIDNPLD